MKASHWSSFAAIAAVGLALGLTGIGWGLPSARRVELLGGSIEKVRAELSARSARDLESRRGQAAILATQPAEEGVDLPRLVRRYLLFSDSPDEPLTLLALANFRPRQLDFNPRMIAYGGLHVYGAGAAMALAHAIGFGRITSDVMHYADHPEDIARLYIAGRLLMVLYNIGIALVLFVFGRSVAAVYDRRNLESDGQQPVVIDRRYSSGTLCGWLAALLWLLSPPSLAFSHIINPHLPAAFWGTLAVWLAWCAGQSPNRRAWLGAAAASGAAASCALNAWLVFLAPVLVALFVWRGDRARLWRELGLAALVAIAMFLALNPYLFANLDVLRQETSRFQEFRQPRASISGLTLFIGNTLSSTSGFFGVLAMILGLIVRWKSKNRADRALVVLAGVILLLGGYLVGSESANPLNVRFAFFLLPLCCVFIAIPMASSWPQLVRATMAALIGTSSLVTAKFYLASFDSDPRDEASAFINRNIPAGSSVLVPKSPGPYELPTFDFSRLRLVGDRTQAHEYVVKVEDRHFPMLADDYDVLPDTPHPECPVTTALSFSGRFVRVYRRPASHQ